MYKLLKKLYELGLYFGVKENKYLSRISKIEEKMFGKYNLTVKLSNFRKCFFNTAWK